MTSQRGSPIQLLGTFGGVWDFARRFSPREFSPPCPAMAPQRGGDGRSLAAEPAGAPSSNPGLPRAFLQSLRPLFDILDDRRRGYVHLREIESRWQLQGGEAGELPRGVLEGLRRAAPASGYLTFDRFVVGLRASLLSPEKGGPPAPAPPLPKGKAPPAERGAGRGCPSRSLEKIPAPQAERLPCKRAGECSALA